MILSVGLEKNCLLLEMLLSGCAKRMPVHVLLLHYGHFCSKTVLFAKSKYFISYTWFSVTTCFNRRSVLGICCIPKYPSKSEKGNIVPLQYAIKKQIISQNPSGMWLGFIGFTAP